MSSRRRLIAVPIAAALGMIFVEASLAANITPIYDANVTQAQKDIIQAKIDLWKRRLSKNINLVIDFANDISAPHSLACIGRGVAAETFIAILSVAAVGRWV